GCGSACSRTLATAVPESRSRAVTSVADVPVKVRARNGPRLFSCTTAVNSPISERARRSRKLDRDAADLEKLSARTVPKTVVYHGHNRLHTGGDISRIYRLTEGEPGIVRTVIGDCPTPGAGH